MTLSASRCHGSAALKRESVALSRRRDLFLWSVSKDFSSDFGRTAALSVSCFIGSHQTKQTKKIIITVVSSSQMKPRNGSLCKSSSMLWEDITKVRCIKVYERESETETESAIKC